MRYADSGYARPVEDTVFEVTLSNFSDFLASINRFDLISELVSHEYPYRQEVEFGDSVIISTSAYQNNVSRVVRFGEFSYAEDGRFLGGNLFREYYMHFDYSQSIYPWGDVLDFGSGYSFQV